jgi:hypothetical protein
MPNFERFDSSGGPHWSGGGTKVLATLTADTKSPTLLIGRYLLEQGFDTTKRYVLLWDARTLELGLDTPTKDEIGFKVTSTMSAKGTHVAYTIKLAGFCKKFGIRDRMKAIFATQMGETWILKMKKK